MGIPHKFHVDSTSQHKVRAENVQTRWHDCNWRLKEAMPQLSATTDTSWKLAPQMVQCPDIMSDPRREPAPSGKDFVMHADNSSDVNRSVEVSEDFSETDTWRHSFRSAELTRSQRTCSVSRISPRHAKPLEKDWKFLKKKNCSASNFQISKSKRHIFLPYHTLICLKCPNKQSSAMSRLWQPSSWSGGGLSPWRNLTR